MFSALQTIVMRPLQTLVCLVNSTKANSVQIVIKTTASNALAAETQVINSLTQLEYA